jgi:hypothetical protein
LEVSISWMPTMMGRWLSSWNGKISPCYEMMGFRWDFWMSLFSCDSQWDLWEILASNIRSSTTQGYTLWLFEPWYRWPIEIDGLPIKNGDFPWQC